MSISNTPSATRPRRHTAVAALWAVTVAALVACGTGSLLVGTAGDSIPDATLSSLVVTPGVLSPQFNPDTTSYAVAVSTATATVTVTATATVPTSTISVNGEPILNGGTSSSIPLDQGTTASIVVRVLSSDSTTSRTYNIAVLRASQ
jgi:hypothetical protein